VSLLVKKNRNQGEKQVGRGGGAGGTLKRLSLRHRGKGGVPSQGEGEKGDREEGGDGDGTTHRED